MRFSSLLSGPAIFLLASTALACRSKERPASGDTAPTASAGGLEAPRRADTGKAMANMPGMPGTGGMANAMMDSMQAHMRMMSSMPADQLAAMVPAHRQMVANMLSQMTNEMRSMKMSGDPAWTATVDSIRQDLIRLPGMTKTELARVMPAHQARVSRLLQMHKDMMAKMGE
jgi:hypothetical protein